MGTLLAWLLVVALADPIDGGATVTLRQGLRAWGTAYGRPVVVVAVDPRVPVLLDALRTNTPGLQLRPMTDPDAAGCVVTVTGPVGEVWTLRGSGSCAGVMLAGLPQPRPPPRPSNRRTYELPIGLAASVATTVLVGAPFLSTQSELALVALPAGWVAGTIAVTVAAPAFARPEALFGALGSLLVVSSGIVAAGVATEDPVVVVAGVALSVFVPAVGGHLLVRHARFLRMGRPPREPAPAESAEGWVLDVCRLPVAGVVAGGGRVTVQPGAVPTDEIAFCLAAWDREDGVVDWAPATVGPDEVVWTQAP